MRVPGSKGGGMLWEAGKEGAGNGIPKVAQHCVIVAVENAQRSGNFYGRDCYKVGTAKSSDLPAPPLWNSLVYLNMDSLGIWLCLNLCVVFWGELWPLGIFCSTVPVSRSKHFLPRHVLMSVVTCCQIAGLLVGNMPKNWPICNEHHRISFSHPLDSLRGVFHKAVSCFNPVPNLSVAFKLAGLEELISASWWYQCYLIGGLQDVFEVINGIFCILYCEESGQVGGVWRDPDKNTEPVASCENTTWGK